MVRMINAHTGTIMWVREARLDEYLARGHTLAPEPQPPKPARKPRASAKETKAGK